MGNRGSCPYSYAHLEVVNKTSQDITTTSVSGCVDSCWAGQCRPDRNFQNVFIGAQKSIERRVALQNRANDCSFTMTLNYRNGKSDTFRINMKHALGCPPYFQDLSKTQDIFYQRINPNKLSITIEKTQDQLLNEKAEEIMKKGEIALKQKKYNVALEQLNKALGLAKETSTTENIKKLIGNVKKEREEKAQEKKKEGDEKFKEKNYQEAVDKFDEALNLTAESSTTDDLKSNKSDAFTELGKNSLEEAWTLEGDTTQDKSQEAQSKFDEAKNFFAEAQSLKNSSENQKNLDVVNLKIHGNNLFNEGSELEKEALGLFEDAKASGDYTTTKTKYNEALGKYQAARKEFEEGAKIDKKFDDSVRVVDELIEEVKKVLYDIDNAELNYNIGKVHLDDEDKKEENEDVDVIATDLEQIIDVTS